MFFEFKQIEVSVFSRIVHVLVLIFSEQVRGLVQLDLLGLGIFKPRLYVNKRLRKVNSNVGHTVCCELHEAVKKVIEKKLAGELASAVTAEADEALAHCEGSRFCKIGDNLFRHYFSAFGVMLVDQDFNDAFRYRLAQRRVAVLNQVEQDGREKVVDLWEMEQLNLNREFLQKFSMLSPRPNHEPEIGLEGDNFLKEL